MATTYRFTISHVDTCLPCYLQDSHSREGEALLSAMVDGSSTWADVLDQLDSDAQSMLDFGASEADDSDAFWRGFRSAFDVLRAEHTEDSTFDDSLEVSEEDDYGEFCYAYFVARWEAVEVESADLSEASGVLRGYIDAVTFTDASDSGEDECAGADWSPAAFAKAKADCDAFESDIGQELHAAYNEAGRNDEHMGHDFWLTRNGHGTGFWDRDELSEELQESLTNHAKRYGETDVYLGDDGLLHMNGE